MTNQIDILNKLDAVQKIIFTVDTTNGRYQTYGFMIPKLYHDGVIDDITYARYKAITGQAYNMLYDLSQENRIQ